MTWRGEVEDGTGWGGLVESKSEQREEARQAALEKATGLRAKDWSPGLGVVDGTELAQLCRAMLEAPGAHLGAYLTQIRQVLIDSEAN